MYLAYILDSSRCSFCYYRCILHTKYMADNTSLGLEKLYASRERESFSIAWYKWDRFLLLICDRNRSSSSQFICWFIWLSQRAVRRSIQYVVDLVTILKLNFIIMSSSSARIIAIYFEWWCYYFLLFLISIAIPNYESVFWHFDLEILDELYRLVWSLYLFIERLFCSGF